jgi:hypothetical protein
MTNPLVPNVFNRSPAATKEQRITWVGAIAIVARGWVGVRGEVGMEQTVEYDGWMLGTGRNFPNPIGIRGNHW